MHLDSRRSALALTALIATAGAITRAASAPGSLETVPGLHVAMFDLPSGKIYVNLPDDLAPGDTASGTVNPVPAGPSERDRARQLQELNGYLLELGGQRAPTSQPVRTFVVPAGVTALAVVLLDAHGRPVGELKAPVGSAAPPPRSFLVPPVGQSGRAVCVSGPFDGDLSATAVQIGGKPAQALAESPRQLVVRGPEEGAAPAPLEVSEHGKVVTTGTYRNVAVRLFAPLTNLLAGQHSRLTITVTGLEGLRETLPLFLANGSPGVVRMEGGDEQTLCVRPDDVKPAGKWTKDRDLTGLHGGGFSIRANLAHPRPQAESSTPLETTLHGWLRERLVLDQPARTAAGEALAAGAYEVVVRGAPERGRARLVLGRNGKPAGTVEAALFKHMPAATICDAHDVADAAQKGGTGPKDSGLNELGFSDDGLFAVRSDNGHLRLVLATPQGDLSIEADLALP
jgi:hypothetical protein